MPVTLTLRGTSTLSTFLWHDFFWRDTVHTVGRATWPLSVVAGFELFVWVQPLEHSHLEVRLSKVFDIPDSAAKLRQTQNFRQARLVSF